MASRRRHRSVSFSTRRSTKRPNPATRAWRARVVPGPPYALPSDGSVESLAVIERGRQTEVADSLENLFVMYEERLLAYQQDPPPADWNGAFQLLKK